MKTFRLWVGLLAVGCLLQTSRAQVIRVVKETGEKASLDWSALRAQDEASRLFVQVLQADLLRSGWFRASAGGDGTYRLEGLCRTAGGLLADIKLVSTGDNRRVLAQSYRGEVENARVLAHRVADDIVLAVTGRPGMASSRLALVGTATGYKELYLCDADGGRLMQLTRDRSVSVAPNWSPDGASLYYTAYLKRFPDVLSINLKTGTRNSIASFSGLNTGAAVSPDGKRLALILSKDGNPELYVRNLAGGELIRLTHTLSAVEASPSWSPDGRRIVFVSDSTGRPQLYIISADGVQPARLRLRGSENVSPDWGSRGLIAYSSRTGGSYQIFVVDPDRPDPVLITSDGADYEDPTWAPNGRHLACSRTERYQSSIYLLDTMGDPPVALVKQKGDWVSPAWGP